MGKKKGEMGKKTQWGPEWIKRSGVGPRVGKKRRAVADRNQHTRELISARNT